MDVPGGIATGVVPVVAPDGSFYIGDRRGDLVAYNADGLPNWGQNLGNFQSIMTSAALGADGSVYVIGYAKMGRVPTRWFSQAPVAVNRANREIARGGSCHPIRIEKDSQSLELDGAVLG